MKCPNCGKEMGYKHGTGQYLDFSGTADDDELIYHWQKYRCKNCRIVYDGTKWIVPVKYRPTEKQEKTILFINNRLYMDLPAITKHQCWLDIRQYFEKAKNTPLHTEDYYEEMQEYMDVGDFY